LLEDPTAHAAALEQIEPLLSIAESQNWPESICRGHIQAAIVYLDSAGANSDPAALARAGERLSDARLVPAGMNLPDVAIAHALTAFKAELVHRQLFDKPRLSLDEVHAQVERAELLVQASGLELWRPEVLAAKGAVEILGDGSGSASLHRRATEMCESQGNCLMRMSPRSILSWLGSELHLSPVFSSVQARCDPIELVGLDLSPASLASSLVDAELGASARPRATL